MPWIFGPGFGGHPNKVEMKELRKFSVSQRAKAFYARTEEFYLKQVDNFQNFPPWAPFPLAVMTCIGIEMIGSYKYGDDFGDKNDHFKKLTEEIHPRFANVHLAPDGKQHRLSYFVYKGFRNSLAHGFYGKWVFVTHQKEKASTFHYRATRRLVVLNVYWFYRRFKEVCGEYFTRLLAATDPAVDPLKTFNETFESNFDLWL
jgi:hypothetical protein